MKLVWLSFLTLSGAVLGQRNPNPCDGVPGVDQFVNDYASCADYFWCYNGVAVPSGPCSEGQGFVEANGGACTYGAAEGCDECPTLDPDTPPAAVSVVERSSDEIIYQCVHRLQVADSTDLECKSYFLCPGGVRTETPIVCGTGLRFNRVTGLCDRADNVPCRAGGGGGGGGGGNPVEETCAPGQTEDINSSAGCDFFIPCDDGVAGDAISCGGTPPLHFNPDTQVCDLPENLVEPCTDPPTL